MNFPPDEDEEKRSPFSDVVFKPLQRVESYSQIWQDMDGTKLPPPYDKWERARLAWEESSAVESGSNPPTNTEEEQSEPLGSPDPGTLPPRASERLTELMICNKGLIPSQAMAQGKPPLPPMTTMIPGAQWPREEQWMP